MKDFKVKCISTDGSACFTKGKIYRIEDGAIIVNDGTKFTFFENVEQLNNYWNSQFELVEENKMFTKDDIRSGDKVWAENGYGIAMRLKSSLIVLYNDHRGWDNIVDLSEVEKVVRTDYGGDLLAGNEGFGTTVYSRQEGIGCEPPVKEISVSEAEKALTEKFGQNVRILVGE